MKGKHFTFLVRFLEKKYEEEFKSTVEKYKENLNVSMFSEDGYIVESATDQDSVDIWYDMGMRYSTFAGAGKEAPINYFGAYANDDSALSPNAVGVIPMKYCCQQ